MMRLTRGYRLECLEMEILVGSWTVLEVGEGLDKDVLHEIALLRVGNMVCQRESAVYK